MGAEAFQAVTLGEGRIPCSILPISEVPDLLKGLSHLVLTGTWRKQVNINVTLQNTLEALQVLTGGPCVALVAKEGDQKAKDNLSQLHARWRQDVVICRQVLRDDTEIVFWPAPTQKDASGKQEPVFFGFHVSCRALDCTFANLARHKSRIPLIFDLDETALVAKSVNQLEKVADAAAKAWYEKRRETSMALTADARKQAKEMLPALQKDEALCRHDLRLLQEFIASDRVTVDGKVYEAQREEVSAEYNDKGVPICRLVIRLEALNIILVRIEHGQPHTSMHMRIRPGWWHVYAFLIGHDKGLQDKHAERKLRFDVYVCTAAKRGYALEAWRQLDPYGCLIEPRLLAERLTCVPFPGNKTLSGCMRLGPPPSQGQSPMPCAIILDDRPEVWLEQGEKQVLQIAPYEPYQSGCTLEELAELHQNQQLNLYPIKTQLHSLRANFYSDLDHKLGPQAEKLLAKGMKDWRKGTAPLLPPIRTIAELLKEPNLPLPALPPPQRGAHFPRLDSLTTGSEQPSVSGGYAGGAPTAEAGPLTSAAGTRGAEKRQRGASPPDASAELPADPRLAGKRQKVSAARAVDTAAQPPGRLTGARLQQGGSEAMAAVLPSHNSGANGFLPPGLDPSSSRPPNGTSKPAPVRQSATPGRTYGAVTRSQGAQASEIPGLGDVDVLPTAESSRRGALMDQRAPGRQQRQPRASMPIGLQARGQNNNQGAGGSAGEGEEHVQPEREQGRGRRVRRVPDTSVPVAEYRCIDTLNRVYTDAVYTNLGPHPKSGLAGKRVEVDGGRLRCDGYGHTEKYAQRWACMRLLMRDGYQLQENQETGFTEDGIGALTEIIET